MTKILTVSNAKILKSVAYGWDTVGIHFAPAELSGHEVCPWRSPACTASCLNTSGMGIFPGVQLARIAKTQWFFSDRASFMSQLVKEIGAAARKAEKNGRKLAVRLNLTSDIPWESIKCPVEGISIPEMFPDVQLMDYSKGIKRFNRYMLGKFPPNYHLTFSRSETNEKETRHAFDMGGNIAVVFHDELPETFWGRKVINGDEHDLRFLDPHPSVVGLSAKGKAKKDTSGFVLDAGEESVSIREMAVANA